MAGTLIRTVYLAALMSLAFPALAGVKEGVDKWQAGDYKAAVVEWLPFAAKGDPDALFNLGQAYKLGRGVPLDKAKAEEFYRRAADKGHAPAQSNLGIVLAQRGEKAAAVELWQKAAEKKDARAQYMLGVLHFNGDTLPKNWPLAYAYMTQANNAGLPQAARALSTMNVNMPQADRDRGAELATAMGAGSRLASSGKPVTKTVANDVSAAKLPSTDAPLTKARQPAPAAVKPAAPTPIKLTNVQPAKVQPNRVVTESAVPESARSSTAGQWRVQLGAYSKESRAREAWTTLQSEKSSLVGKAEPFYVTGNDVVRLQLGGFADSASANRMCKDLKDVGRACFVVQAN